MIVPLSEEIFIKHLKRLYTRLCVLETNKHFPPTYSCAIKELAEYYNLKSHINESIESSNMNINKNLSTFMQSMNSSFYNTTARKQKILL